MLGAAIGTFGGWKVVQYSHAHPTPLNKLLVHLSVAPVGETGARVALSAVVP
jgi:hypothetical protein